MAKKTYRTYFLKGYQLLLTAADGSRVEVKFRGGIQVDSTSKYTTSNEEVQELLEKASGFNRDYYVESVEEAAPAAEPAPAPKAEKPKVEKQVLSEVKDSRRFKNLVEMKNAMKEAGIAFDENATYAQAKAVAAAAGYDYQIKK